MKRRLFVVIVATVALLALVSVGTALGQEPPDEAPPVTALEPAEFPDDVDTGTEGQVQAEGEVGAMAEIPGTLNYQGYLTDSSGNPRSGTYAMSATLYSQAGNIRWGPETHNSISVSDGLFHIVLGENDPLAPHVFDEDLRLGLFVNGTALPWQPLRPVAYAFGLVPGAEVEGKPQGTNYALTVINTQLLSDQRGLFARGIKYGLVAEETGPLGDVGIYSPDFVEALGYKSKSDSYVWVPGYAAISSMDTTSAVTITPTYSGTADLSAGSAGEKYLYVPMTIPSQLYGQEVRVEQLAVYYYTDDQTTYIDQTVLARMVSAGQDPFLINNNEDRKSTDPTSYTLNTSGNYTLTAESGPVSIQLKLNFADTTHKIHLMGVRLRLGHVD